VFDFNGFSRSETTARFYAASFGFGWSPARAANRTSKSTLNRSILPRFRSDTRARVTPSNSAASACVMQLPE
jgi:hypothetical protein